MLDGEWPAEKQRKFMLNFLALWRDSAAAVMA
jgi:hypothetical protein